MNKIYHLSNESFIAYKEHKSKKNLPTIVFLHGLHSSLESSKALYMHDFCEKKDFPFVRFSALGHNFSSGEFTKQSIDSWFNSAKEFISNISENGVILVGSSMGGWISLLLARDLPNIVKGVVGIAPAPDFTEDIYNALPIELRSIIDNSGVASIRIGQYTYNISHFLIRDSKKHLLLHLDELSINCPIHILHGMLDTEVSYKKSLSIIEKISAKNALCTFIKTGNHALSRPEDLKLLSNALVKMLEE